jgi:hypothetical protein
MPGFAANPSRRVSLTRVGQSGFPVICVDDFLLDAGNLVELAVDAAFVDVGSVYPGVRAPAPPDYSRTLLQALAASIAEVFGAPPEPELDLCAFSLVTTPAPQLRPIQRIPHFDGPEHGRLAWLHYLCDEHQGGTSFYRHWNTGLERVAGDSLQGYRTQLLVEMEQQQASLGYACGTTAFFEKIHSVPAAFNRLIIYPGNALHSGDIGVGTVLSEDPRLGRLTINGFGFLRS